MYVHIGKDQLVNENNIIGIFDIEAMKLTKENKEMYEKMKKNIIDISEGTQKTLILIKDNKIKGYITNISSKTIQRRGEFLSPNE